MDWRRVRRIARRIWIGAALSFSAYLVLSYQAIGLPPAALERALETPDALIFAPSAPNQKAGLLFFPGGMVDPDAYAPIAKAVAGAGFEARILKLPLRSAPLESQRDELFAHAADAMASSRWVLAGHSRGGMLAARFTREQPDLPCALVLMGTTHPRDFDLSSLRIPVVKIYGTADEVASHSASRRNAHLLPAATRWIAIEGGNHAQFGWYGRQLGDGRATISREEQQRIVIRTLLDTLIRCAS